jgi:hypothetical protein
VDPVPDSLLSTVFNMSSFIQHCITGIYLANAFMIQGMMNDGVKRSNLTN